ncbi:hypothetical protein BDV18DRAFT_147525 [Aspergillus unguis]
MIMVERLQDELSKDHVVTPVMLSQPWARAVEESSRSISMAMIWPCSNRRYIRLRDYNEEYEEFPKPIGVAESR